MNLGMFDLYYLDSYVDVGFVTPNPFSLALGSWLFI